MSHTCIFFSSPDALKEPNHCVCRLRARCSSGVIGRNLRLRHATKRHFSELCNLEHSLPSVGLKQLWIGHECSKLDRKSTRLNSSHEWISYAVFCLKKKKKQDATM